MLIADQVRNDGTYKSAMGLNQRVQWRRRTRNDEQSRGGTILHNIYL